MSAPKDSPAWIPAATKPISVAWAGFKPAGHIKYEENHVIEIIFVGSTYSNHYFDDQHSLAFLVASYRALRSNGPIIVRQDGGFAVQINCDGTLTQVR